HNLLPGTATSTRQPALNPAPAGNTPGAHENVRPKREDKRRSNVKTFWSPVTESNRRPSPYHRDPLKAPARHYTGRPGQTLYFSSVGPGSGQFAPDAASQIPPNRWRRRNPCPTPVSPGPTCVRYPLPPRGQSLPKQSAAGSAPTATHRPA